LFTQTEVKSRLQPASTITIKPGQALKPMVDCVDAILNYCSFPDVFGRGSWQKCPKSFYEQLAEISDEKVT